MTTSDCSQAGQLLPKTYKIIGRLVQLEPMTLDDVSDDYVGWLNDQNLVRYSNQRFLTHSLESCRDYVGSFFNSNNRFLKIVSKIDGQLVGTMTAYVSPHHGTVDMGILVGGPANCGRGFGQDAWDSLLYWLVSTKAVRKVTGGCVRSNSAMVRIMEKSGMKLEAVRVKQEVVEGEFQDLLYYAKFR